MMCDRKLLLVRVIAMKCEWIHGCEHGCDVLHVIIDL